MKAKGKLGARIILITIAMFLVLLVFFMMTLEFSSRKSVENTIGAQAVNTAQNIAKQLDVEKYKELAKNPTESDLYWELREELNDLREKNGVMYLYTYAVPEKDGDVTFLVDGMPKDDIENAGAIGDASSSTTYEDIEKVIEDGSYYTGILTSDTFGQFLSGTIPLKDEQGNIVAFLGVDIQSNVVDEVKTTVLKTILPGTVIFMMLIILVASYIMYRYVNRSLKPLNGLTEAALQFADGDIIGTNKTLDTIQLKGKNEITVFTQAFSQTLHKLSETFGMIQSQAYHLQEVVNTISQTAKSVESSNGIITNSIIEIASGSEQQQSSNQDVVLTMNEMTSGIQRLADSTTEIAEASSDMTSLVESSVSNANNVVSQIHNVEQSVLKTAGHVEEMGEKFRSIEEMVTVITNIASQTNLLALNAAIEAARAGESGKGFAVVADEVRKLAEMSRTSAEDIHNHIASFELIIERALSEMMESATEVKGGNIAVQSIGEKLQQIMQSVSSVNDKIQDDSAVIEEMSASSEEILATTEQMSKISSEATVRTQEVVKSADHQVNMMAELHEVVHKLDVTSEQMIKAIRQFKI